MAEKTSKKETADKSETQKPRCGIIMPISEIDGCSAEHWADVKDLLIEVIGQTDFEGDLVSNAGEVRIIHETIVQNIYNNDMIICDVSGKNPNVMFELGLRLAFDKPAIIIKDDVTNYSFDTSPIEHLEYPRDLNYKKINDFKVLLREKLEATFKKYKADKNYSPFLKSFGQFKVAGIETKEVSKEEFIIKELDEIKKSIWSITSASQPVSKQTYSGKMIANSDNLNIRSFDMTLDQPQLSSQVDEKLFMYLPNYPFETGTRKNETGYSYRVTFDKPLKLGELSPVMMRIVKEIQGTSVIAYYAS